ncbi:MAG: 3',5'-cyclic-nucleotide phosphodiesterase [Candidatus Coatesbacteria bacterium]|nr:3',5'-cyclic-nucleotide phosphodiesterase [Candidatus Coatesbacteria bacterium]
MKLRVLGCYGGVTQDHRVTGFLINDHILLEGGTVPAALLLSEQRQIDAAIVSHSHLDHCAGLAFLADNIFADTKAPVRIIATQETAQAIQNHLFNGTVWPDFTTITRIGKSVTTFEVLEVENWIDVDELKVKAFYVEHTVETVGFLVSDRTGTLLYSADTSDLTPVINQIGQVEDLRLAIVESSFPNSFRDLAQRTGHLVPEQIRELSAHLGSDVPIRLFHMKPRYVEQIERDVASLDGDVALLRQGEIIKF